MLQEKIFNINDLTGFVLEFYMKVLSSGYIEGKCILGNNGGKRLSKRIAAFKLKTSSYEEESLELIHQCVDNDYPYKIVARTYGEYESCYEIKLMLDDLEEHLPKKMIEELYNEFYKFTDDYIVD